MMTVERKRLARVMFQLKAHQANGFAFEHLFAAIMEYSRPGFQKIKPYGNQGDRGNDGYEKDAGRYFQVFAPEDPTKSKSAAIKKVATDFESKLLPHWAKFCVPSDYIFVFNDKYSGSNFDIEKCLAELKAKHKLNACKVFLCKDLEEEFLSLPEDQICMIVGGLPTLDPVEGLDYSALAAVIRYIQETPPDDLAKGKLIAPDFEEKVQFNQLDESGHWLRAKQREVWQIDDFLSRNSDFVKQDLRDSLSGYYKESLNHVAVGQSHGTVSIGDLRFSYVLNRISPKTQNSSLDRLKRDAALVLMSKYFEACDIFEEPKYASA